MLLLGCPPNSADYDGRCALELACVKGQVEVVRLLLAAGANPSQKDNLGFSPLAEACKLGHDDLIDILVDVSPMQADGCFGQRTLHKLLPTFHTSNSVNNT